MLGAVPGDDGHVAGPHAQKKENRAYLLFGEIFIMHTRKLALLAGAMALVLASGTATGTPLAERSAQRQLPASIDALRLDVPLESAGLTTARLDPSLLAAEGESRVIIRLVNPSVAQQGLTDRAAVHARDALRLEQAAFLDRVRALDPNARVVATVQIVLNAVFVEVDASVLPQLANDPAVARIAPVADYELDLSETVPYIGASAVQNSGFTGRGIKVAVLDSGLYYTHAAFGGPGDPFLDEPSLLRARVSPGGFGWWCSLRHGYPCGGPDWSDWPRGGISTEYAGAR
jgi:hypothetical protein